MQKVSVLTTEDARKLLLLQLDGGGRQSSEAAERRESGFEKTGNVAPKTISCALRITHGVEYKHSIDSIFYPTSNLTNDNKDEE